jgi:hypothetical protein
MSRSWNNGKSQKTDKEFSKNQKLSHENKKLKNEISRLRKAITRIESGWCPGCLKEHSEPEEASLSEPSQTKVVRKDRTCFKCNEGQLRIFKYPKIGEMWYFRKCDACGHRTNGKKFTPDVQD